MDSHLVVAGRDGLSGSKCEDLSAELLWQVEMDYHSYGVTDAQMGKDLAGKENIFSKRVHYIY